MEDEWMIAIQFCNTPRQDFLHSSFIFRNPEPLGEKMKNATFLMLVAMLHLDIQKGKEAMKTSEFQKIYRRYYFTHEETSYCY